MGWRRRLQLTAALVFICAFAGLSHYSNSAAKTHDLGVFLAVAPPLMLGFLLLWRFTRWWIALLAASLAAILVRHFWPALEQNFADLYLLQEGSFYLLMAASFGQSLLRNRVAFCTQLADRIHGPLTPREVQYTRNVTAAWVLFFLAIAAATLVLYEFAPLRVWSFFANFCVIPLMALMFLAEYGVRRLRLPQQHRGILEAVRVYFASGR